MVSFARLAGSRKALRAVPGQSGEPGPGRHCSWSDGGKGEEKGFPPRMNADVSGCRTCLASAPADGGHHEPDSIPPFIRRTGAVQSMPARMAWSLFPDSGQQKIHHKGTKAQRSSCCIHGEFFVPLWCIFCLSSGTAWTGARGSCGRSGCRIFTRTRYAQEYPRSSAVGILILPLDRPVSGQRVSQARFTRLPCARCPGTLFILSARTAIFQTILSSSVFILFQKKCVPPPARG